MIKFHYENPKDKIKEAIHSQERLIAMKNS